MKLLKHELLKTTMPKTIVDVPPMFGKHTYLLFVFWKCSIKGVWRQREKKPQCKKWIKWKVFFVGSIKCFRFCTSDCIVTSCCVELVWISNLQWKIRGSFSSSLHDCPSFLNLDVLFPMEECQGGLSYLCSYRCVPILHLFF